MAAKKEDDELQPTFYYQPPRSLVQELLRLANAKAITDLTAGAGTWALAAIERPRPVFRRGAVGDAQPGADSAAGQAGAAKNTRLLSSPFLGLIK